MNSDIKTRIMVGMAYASVEAHHASINFGYWEKRRSVEDLAQTLFKDVGEVMLAGTMGKASSTTLVDCTQLEEALATIILRCLDIGAQRKLHMAAAIIAKLEYNERHAALCKLNPDERINL